MISRTLLLGSIFLIIGLLILLLSLYRLIRRTGYYSRGHTVKRPPRSLGIAGILAAVISLAISWSLFWAADNLKFFRRFNDNRVCFRLDVWRTEDPVKSLKLIISYPGQDTAEVPPPFYLSGDIWQIQGEAIWISGPAKYLFDGERCFAIRSAISGSSQSWQGKPSDFIFDKYDLPAAKSRLKEAVSNIGIINSCFRVVDFKTIPHEAQMREAFVGKIASDGVLSLEPIEPTLLPGSSD